MKERNQAGHQIITQLKPRATALSFLGYVESMSWAHSYVWTLLVNQLRWRSLPMELGSVCSEQRPGESSKQSSDSIQGDFPLQLTQPVQLQLRLCNSNSQPATHTYTNTHTLNESLSHAFASHKHHAGTQPEANKAGKVSEHVGQADEEYGHSAYVILVPPSRFTLPFVPVTLRSLSLSLFLLCTEPLVNQTTSWLSSRAQRCSGAQC